MTRFISSPTAQWTIRDNAILLFFNCSSADFYRLLRKRNAEKQLMEDGKTDIGWGHQIRSYVLDQSRIKDLRTNVEIGNTQGVLDGDLDEFISASLKQGV